MVHKIIAMTVIENKGKVLCLTRSDTTIHRPGDWDLPGGKLAPDEEYAEGAAREVQEETGLIIGALRFVYASTQEYNNDTVIFLFYVASIGDAHVRLSSEHVSYDWLTIDELLAKQDMPPVHAALRFIAKYNLL